MQRLWVWSWRRTRRCFLMGWLILGGFWTGGCDTTPPETVAPQPASVTSAPTASTPVETIRFTDVTGAAGLAFHHEAGARGNKWFPETMGAGGGFFDYNGDGWVDILLINGRSWPADTPAVESTMQLYRNQGDGTFQDVTRQSGLAISLYGMGLATADYDNDGDQDLVVTGYRQTLLLRNNGNGAFTDVTALAGIAQGGWSTAAAFVDIDRDGWLDLLIGHYVEWDPAKEVGLDCTYGTPQKDYCAVKYFPGLGLQLYRNQGNGQFMDITESAGVRATEARVLGITIIDYNQDSWPDILVANDLTPTLLFANQGNGTFRDLGVPSGLVLDEGGMAFAGMGVDAAYINNNSQLCVAIGNFTGQPTTLHCQVRSGDSYHLEVFTEQSYRAGIARPTLRMVTFGLFFFDADLDGWQDLFMVNGHVANEERLRNVPYAQPPQLLRNQGNGTFAEVMRTPESGLNFQCIGRGAAYADFDHDGDLDLLLTANQGRVYLLRNDTPRPGHFLRVVTRGTRSNRDGIGAQVRLYTTRRQLTGMVRTGSSYLSQSDTAPTFGLQADEVIDRLEVTWPSGSVETFRGLPLDATFVARESTTPAPVAQPSSTPGAPALSLKHAAVAHYQAGRLDAAASVFKQFLQNQPEDYVAQQYLIELYWRLGQYESARALLRNMSQMLTDANACMQFAFHLEDNQLYDLADQVYHEAVQLDPQAPEALYRLGKNALRARRYNDASTYFRQALQRHPGFVEAQHGLGLAAAERGETALAEQAFREVLRLVPDHAEAHTHLGQIYTRTGRLEAALAAYRRVVQLQPERAQGYHNLGTVLATQGKTAAARAQFHEALRRDPGYFPAHNDLGTLYAEQGEIVLAIEAFRAALQIDPHSVPARYNLALAYGARGEHQTMQQELREILRLAPRNSDAHRQLGVSYLQQGQAAAAIEQFRALSALLPQEAEAQYLLALAYAQIDQAAPMLTALQRTVQLDANHARAHSALASYYWQHQHYDLAWQHGNRAAQLGVPMAPLLDALHRVRQSGR